MMSSAGEGDGGAGPPDPGARQQAPAQLTPNGASPDAKALHAKAAMVPRITTGFIPLRILVERMLTSAYNELKDLVKALPNMSNTPRKRAILEYLLSTRRQFIKLLVLSRWTNVAEEVHRCIDILAWLQGKKACFQTLVYELQEMRRQLSYSQVRSADLVTAAKVLATRSFPSLEEAPAHRGYLTRAVLTPAKTLDTLQRLDRLISFRLRLRETIPEPFARYTIDSGRVVFHVEHEFTVACSFVEDDFSRKEGFQWFVVSFDLEGELADRIGDATVAEIERLANEKLAADVKAGRPQLVSLYGFLHSLALKFRVLCIARKLELASQRGPDVSFKYTLDRENLSLSVEYWPGRAVVHGSTRTPAKSEVRVYVDSQSQASVVEKMLARRRNYHDYDHSRIVCTWTRDKVDPSEQLGDDVLQATVSGSDPMHLVHVVARAHASFIMQQLYEAMVNESCFVDTVHLKHTVQQDAPKIVVEIVPKQVVSIHVSIQDGQYVFVDETSPWQPCKLVRGAQMACRNENITPLAVLKRLQTAFIQSRLENCAYLHDFRTARLTSRSINVSLVQKYLGIKDLVGLTFFTKPEWRRHLHEQASGSQVAAGEVSHWFIVAHIRRCQITWWMARMTCSCKLTEIDRWSMVSADRIAFMNPSSQVPSKAFRVMARLVQIRDQFVDMEQGLLASAVPFHFATAASVVINNVKVPVMVVEAGALAHQNGALQNHIYVRLVDSQDKLRLLVQGRAKLAKISGETELDTHTTEQGSFSIDRGSGYFQLDVEPSVAYSETVRYIGFIERALTLSSQGEIASTRLVSNGSLVDGVKFVYNERMGYWVDVRPQLAPANHDYQVSVGGGKANPHKSVEQFLNAFFAATRGNLRALIAVLQATAPLVSAIDAISSIGGGSGGGEKSNIVVDAVAQSLSLYRIYYYARQKLYCIQTRLAMGSGDDGDIPGPRYMVQDAAIVGNSNGRLARIPLFQDIASDGLDLDDDELNGAITPHEAGLTVRDSGLFSTVLERVHNMVIETLP